MSLSNEWTDWHLTPDGWESGSERTDFGHIEEKEPPVNRVLTVRYSEVQTSVFGEMHRGHEARWESSDKEAIERLVKKFGDPPSRL